LKFIGVSKPKEGKGRGTQASSSPSKDKKQGGRGGVKWGEPGFVFRQIRPQRRGEGKGGGKTGMGGGGKE